MSLITDRIAVLEAQMERLSKHDLRLRDAKCKVCLDFHLIRVLGFEKGGKLFGRDRRFLRYRCFCEGADQNTRIPDKIKAIGELFEAGDGIICAQCCKVYEMPNELNIRTFFTADYTKAILLCPKCADALTKDFYELNEKVLAEYIELKERADRIAEREASNQAPEPEPEIKGLPSIEDMAAMMMRGGE